MDQHIVLGILFLVVAIVAVISFIRQLKFRNYLAILFSILTAIVFGFFSVSTIISVLSDSL